ncbi:MAG: hypothetical protein ACI8X5_003032 [Planctomycetota bacterium]|jgi:hypothetical protein
METLKDILVRLPWIAWVIVVAIIFSSVKSIVRMTHTHIERMEKIRRGYDPDDTGEETH